jgi:transposase-like protein
MLRRRRSGSISAARNKCWGCAKAPLEDLIERGLPAVRSLLFVIDGAKALRKAITDAFGSRAPIQRCREHKKRVEVDNRKQAA